MAKILIIDEDRSDLNFATTLLRDEGHDVFPLLDKNEANEQIRSHQFDVIMVEIGLLPITGVDLVSISRRDEVFIPIIVLTKESQLEVAQNAMELGVFSYITKPLQINEFIVTVTHAVNYHKMHAENAQLRNLLNSSFARESLIASSPTVQALPAQIAQAAQLKKPILIEGQAGTGKAFMAKTIHTQSDRSNQNFIEINCKAIPIDGFELEFFGYTQSMHSPVSSPRIGKIELAKDGTLFIDEVALLSEDAQQKLLSFMRTRKILKHGLLQPIEIDTNIIAASSDPLESYVESGTFNQQLFEELSGFTIKLPLLKDRIEDIPLLIRYFLEKHKNNKTTEIELEPKALDILKQYSWPGNIRELENVIWQFCTFTQNGQVTEADIPFEIRNAVSATPDRLVSLFPDNKNGAVIHPLNEFTRLQEKAYIDQVVQRMQGDKMKAANALQISLTTLYRKLLDPQGESSNSESTVAQGSGEEP